MAGPRDRPAWEGRGYHLPAFGLRPSQPPFLLPCAGEDVARTLVHHALEHEHGHGRRDPAAGQLGLAGELVQVARALLEGGDG